MFNGVNFCSQKFKCCPEQPPNLKRRTTLIGCMDKKLLEVIYYSFHGDNISSYCWNDLNYEFLAFPEEMAKRTKKVGITGKYGTR